MPYNARMQRWSLHNLRHWQHAPAIGAYLFVVLVYTLPLPLHLGDTLAGDHVPDTMQNYWNLWWTNYALVGLHQNPYHASYIQFPFGLPLLFHTYNVLGNVLSLPLQWCCGTTVAYNSMLLLSFWLAACFTYALAFHLTRNRFAAFVAGIIFAFSPYMAFHLKAGQPFMVAVQWFPLYLLLLLKGLHERPRWLWAAGGALLLIGLTDWHYTVYALLLTAVVLGYTSVQAWRNDGWRAVRRVVGQGALVGAVFTVGMSPILVAVFSELASQEYASRDLRHSIFHSVDVAAFVLPSIFHPLWGDWASGIFYGRLVEPFIAGGVASPGWVPLALAGLAVAVDRRRSALYLLLAAVFGVLALGPYLRVYGWQSADSATPIPLPYLLFRALPFMDIHRIPSRFIAVFMLALALLAAVAVAWLTQHRRLLRLPMGVRYAVLATLVAVLLFEYWARPFPLTAAGIATLPPYYQQLARTPPTTAAPILEIPDLDARSMYYQTYHQQPIMGGQISRPRGHPWRRAQFFGAVLQVQPTWDDIASDTTPAAVRSALACQDIAQVVVYKQETGEATRRRIEQLERNLFADVAPVYEDDLMRVYEPVNMHAQRPYWTPHPDEWYPPEVLPQLDTTARWAQGERASLLIYPCGQQQATVAFDIFSYARNRTIDVLLNDQPYASFTIAEGWVRRVQLVVPLHDDATRLTFVSREPAAPLPAASTAPASSRTLSFNMSHVTITQPTRPTPTGMVE